MKLDNKLQRITVAVVIIVSVFYISYQIGTAQDETSNVDGVINSESIELSEENDFDVFWEVIELIESKHINGDSFDNQKAIYGAIEGVIKSLDDPYSSFFAPEDAKKFSEDISGNFGGIGAEIGIRDNQLTVIAPLKGSPAETAGLKGGDKILMVDEELTEGMSIDQSVKIIRGEEGTDVTLLVSREEWESPREITVTRGNIQVPTLDWEIDEHKIAYIQLYSFNANAPQLFYKASLEVLMKGSKGLVLDLRNNSGGYLDVAVNIAGWMLKRGELVVVEDFPSKKDREFRSSGNGAWGNLPIVILVNGGSASASEILAGTVRDSLGAILVGENTFGKGTVQEVQALRDGSTVKLTVAKWILPSGQIIDESGLKPDVIIEMPEEIEDGYDPQLEKAMEIIREKTKNIGSVKIKPPQE
ncbi:MAG: S41 family peptidase [Candidatus Paceibacterota bacterium]